jgi:uncharacterized membrane protein
MSNLIVITFEDTSQAGQVRDSLKKAEKDNLLKIDDMAVVTKDAEGKVHIDGDVSSGVTSGAIAGGVVGLVLLGVFAPVLGIAGGAALGGVLGKKYHGGLSKDFVEQVSADLHPNTSALFVIGEDGNIAAILSLLRNYQGKVYQTSLPEDIADQMREALKDKGEDA